MYSTMINSPAPQKNLLIFILLTNVQSEQSLWEGQLVSAFTYTSWGDSKGLWLGSTEGSFSTLVS